MHMRRAGDFSKGTVSGNILRLAGPLIFAQLVSVLYSVVDRMYIGRLPDASAYALTGIGLTFPIISIVTAFANLFGTGGAPLFSIARGRGDDEEAARVLGCTCKLLTITGAALMGVMLICKGPLLYLFGASNVTFPYANDYLTIYLFGSVFVLLSLGLNGFINAQGFGSIGMLTVLIGAVLNIALDPLFIFVLHLGVRGAAIATVLSQFVSAAWAVSFLAGKRAVIRLRRKQMRLRAPLVRRIMTLGLAGFIMSVTNSGVQIVCNVTLQAFGGDLYVGAMTVINSVREIAQAPMQGLSTAAQPFLGYNYGAKQYARVRKGIVFLSLSSVSYTVILWGLILAAPRFFVGIFSEDAALAAVTVPAMHIYFFGFFMMALQNAGQSTALALGKSRQAIFFSLLRKAIIVIPLTLVLPRLWGLGVNGVFLAEPVSNFLGGGACYLTMLLTIWRELKREDGRSEATQK